MSTVAKIMNKKPRSVGPKTSIASAAKTMRAARVGSLFVKKGRQLVGVVTDTAAVERGWERRYLVRPLAQPAGVGHVIVLVVPPDADAGRAFAPRATVP